MKWFVMFCFISTSSWGRSPEILKCLGAEEKELHANKDTGPTYELNQRLISEMVQIPNALIRSEEFKSICDARGSESWKLLELSMSKGKSVFVIPQNLTGIQRQMTEGMIEDYVDGTKEIFLNFISQIQALSPTPQCLTEEIPVLKNFFEEIKHLQGDISIEAIFKGREKIIFKELKDYRSTFQRCSERLKKKLSSESTKGRKKS